ncbi:hypothetical protein TIFTF001_037833 [Ficus carica]|uniref:Uncharacterized protein n=1 Tax=Ficus carica TaxID=3494 RepID=A0AA88JCI3_FICCA|nr:hypothetical protein TIFTF001_037825 [Ficus carica]GMN68775.1 hypothetical protein TIFTF001_037827 [Ficus carica]GMN68780.1 hypothetical protein TIFTF001_037831 [Ficus carica]GMN68781.1 hypothetical protein TIFTF001_037833 [Ficus carica]
MESSPPRIVASTNRSHPHLAKLSPSLRAVYNSLSHLHLAETSRSHLHVVELSAPLGAVHTLLLRVCLVE